MEKKKKEAKAVGVGGVFIYADDPRKLAEWYRDRLGIEFEDWGSCFGHVFRWRDADDPEAKGSTTWAIHPAKEGPLGAGRNQHMVNYRVPGLDGLLASLAEAGEEAKIVEEGEYGRFAHLRDPEGNRIELWEPPDGM